jgi:hypothetical protein
MKEIYLTRGLLALVDDEDFPKLSGYMWQASKKNNAWYAKRDVLVDGKTSALYMHRAILDVPPGFEVDHRDGDGLNNQRDNLRQATHRQNLHNSRPFDASGFKGVTWHKGAHKWMAQIKPQAGGPNKYLGCFADPEEAARVYDAVALELRGEFARLNFPAASS